MRGSVRLFGLLALVVVAVTALVWRAFDGADTAPMARAVAQPAPPTLAFFDPVESTPQSAPAQSQRQQLLAQVQLADHTYCSYLEGSRYPPGSRPAAEQADQLDPRAPVAERQPMRLADGGSEPGVQIESSQSRVHLAAGESVAFTLRAQGEDGQALPLVVTRALAQGLAGADGRPGPQLALAFGDDGKGPDTLAADGIHSAQLAPALGNLAGFDGTIRTEVHYTVAGRSGRLLFDVIYSSLSPAQWRGPVREALQDGALVFYLAADMRLAGRYLVSGRVDDARGRPLAVLSANEVLAAGPNEIRLTLAGKLLRDQAALMPVSLRDVEAFLLRENADPDRALMPRLAGSIHTSKNYALQEFSEAEWVSEERSRYLDEFGKDLAMARTALAAFDPGALPPDSACASPAEPVPGQRSLKETSTIDRSTK